MNFDGIVLAAVSASAAVVSAALIAAMLPLLRAYAVTPPNTRSLHRHPTPQGGGAAVVLATYLTAWCGLALAEFWPQADLQRLLLLTGASALLAVVGAVDDVCGLPPLPRLLAQGIAVGAVIAFLPERQIIPWGPWWLERLCLFAAGLWFVNLVNFMDGADWMMVAEVVPLTAATLIVGWLASTPPATSLVAAALLGAIVGFAPFNKPAARLFLGDVGSLPIGLTLGWLLLQLALQGYLFAAALLPLYYVADTTLTLARRILHGEPFWEAHRSHFYQRAVTGGMPVATVVGRVFAVNIALVALALLSIRQHNLVVSEGAFAAGIAVVALLLANFAKWGKREGNQAASPRKSGTASRKTE